MVATPVTYITLAGKLNDANFQRAKKAAEIIMMAAEGVDVKIYSLLPTDYEVFVLTAMLNVGVDRPHKGNLYIGGIGPFQKLCREEFGYTDRTNNIMYERMAKVHFRTFVENSKHKFVQMELAVGGHTQGRMIIELFTDICPDTCQNFLDLVTREEGAGPRYKGSVCHRVVPNGWVQWGDIVKGKGNDGVSASGEKCFADETFLVKHDKPGIVAMASTGPHTNSSQFYVTLDALPWLDNRRVAFGRVIDGMRTLRVISKMEMNNERPVQETTIRECGIYEV